MLKYKAYMLCLVLGLMAAACGIQGAGTSDSNLYTDGGDGILPPLPDPTPTPMPTPPPGQTPQYTFNLEGVYLVSNPNNTNWNFNMNMQNGRQITRIEIEFDVYVAGWDPLKSNGYHGLFWLQRGTWPNNWSWAGNNIGYLNIRGPGAQGNKVVFSSTVNGNNLHGSRSFRAQVGAWYHVKWVYNAPAGNVTYQLFKNNTQVFSNSHQVSQAPVVVQNGGYFIQFGTQRAEAGPEADAFGWKFADFTAKLY